MFKAEFVQTGNSLDYTPSVNVAAGDVVVQGELVGIATHDIKANKLGAIVVSGVFDVVKAAGDAFDAGQPLFWDENDEVAVADPGILSWKSLGYVVEEAGAGTDKVRVLLARFGPEASWAGVS